MVRGTISSLKRFLSKEQSEILSAATMLIIIGLVTKITGMVFVSLVARAFGAERSTDIFYLASVIPEAITNIILMGAVSASIIPIFIKLKEEKGESLFLRSFTSTFNLCLLIFIVIAVIAAIFSKQLIPFAIEIAQHKGDPLTTGEVSQVVAIMRVMLIPQIILAMSAFASTTLNIYHRFIIPQLAPLFFNVGRIVGVLVFVPMLNHSIWGIVWGTVFGSLLHLLIQIPLLSHLNLNLRLGFIDFKDRHFKEVLKLGLPRTFSLGVEQIAIIVDSLIAISLVRGSLSAYQYAVRLIAVPLGLFGTSFAVAAFPTLSKLYANGSKEELSALINKLINQILFLTLPLTVIFLVMRVPIVRLVYGILDGNFSWDATLQVAWIVMFFTLGLSFEALRSALFRVYYAAHNSFLPLVSSILVVVLGIITGVTFTNYFSHFSGYSLSEFTLNFSYFFSRGDSPTGVAGLALSSSFVFTVEFLFLLYNLRRLQILTSLRPTVKQILRKLLAAFLMFVVTYAMAKLWDQILDTARTLQLILLTVSTMFTSLLFYLWTAFILNIPEVEIFVGFVVKNIKLVIKK